ncbi:MAG: 23S rRNA (adenine(2503)-C(2))-methyltransferase RlmN [Alphaproteobacteria bacterium]|nr:23S rRNA (adenine(2503)-C(2))-methyltransferase RlmN [Alphaproteobacteria bacterium]
MKPVLFDFTDAELEKFVTDLGQPRFRAKQIRDWLNRGAPDFESMKNLPATLRKQLDENAQTLPVRITTKLESRDGQTTKFLLELGDGEQIECVLMRTSYGNSVCVSSQAGCAMGCKFCASTLLGLKRNLTTNEMFAQILIAQWTLRNNTNEKSIHPNGDANNDDVSHIVIMGTGEPLQNVENVIGFMERANSDMGIGWRRITLSTCGIVPGIKRLIEWGRPINLAISLHAPTDELRSQIMPINNRYKLEEVLIAADEFTNLHNRQLMIEYILLGKRGENGDVVLYNATGEYAEKLSKLLHGKNCMVNLIPWNTVDERDFASISGNAVHRFQDILIKNGIHTRIRRERGTDIGSACGQLRLKHKKEEKNATEIHHLF